MFNPPAERAVKFKLICSYLVRKKYYQITWLNSTVKDGAGDAVFEFEAYISSVR